MQNIRYLVSTYTVIWTILFAYVFSIARRQQRMGEELTALESEVKGANPADSDEASREKATVTV